MPNITHCLILHIIKSKVFSEKQRQNERKRQDTEVSQNEKGCQKAFVCLMELQGMEQTPKVCCKLRVTEIFFKLKLDHLRAENKAKM